MTADLLRYASEIVAVYVANNELPAKDVPVLLSDVLATLGRLAEHAPRSPTELHSSTDGPVDKVVRLARVANSF